MRVEREVSFPNFVEWVWSVVKEHRHHGMPMEDLDVDVLSCLPKTTTLRYQRMKAYGNHLQVSDCNMEGMVSFDCGVASSFGQWQTHMGDVDAMVEYVGLIKYIFKLDYGPISTPIIFMWCAWVRNKNDVKGNPTYRQDEVGFLVCNY